MSEKPKRSSKRQGFKAVLKRSLRFVWDFGCGFAVGLLLLRFLPGSGLPEIIAGLPVSVCYLVLLQRLRQRKSRHLDQIRSGAAVCVLVLLGYLVLAFHSPLRYTRAFTPAVWLPNPHVASNLAVDQLGTVQANWNFRYGTGLMFRPVVDGGLRGAMVLEAHNSIGLQTRTCPDIANIEPVDSQGCHKIGEVHGVPVYAISRSLPLGDYEVYTELDGTFISVNMLVDDPETALPYLSTFRKVPANQVERELANNNKAAKARNAYLDHERATVRQRLPFTPVVPSKTALPANWFSFDETRIGGSLKQPNLVESSYGDGEGNIVVVMVIAASSFHLQSGMCSPVPHEPKPVNCLPYGNQGYYYANGSALQYLFRQVGDAMTITQILLDDSDFTTPGKETSVLQVGQAIVDSLHPVDKSALTHVNFVDGYGQY